jgi:Low specificity phosphatase (HAD superfamily)
LNITQIIISTEQIPIVSLRANKLGIQSFFGIKDKKNKLAEYCKEQQIDLNKVVFIGNDLNDYEVMNLVGFPICPADAHSKIKSISKYVIPIKGGFGVIRYFCDMISEDIC